jgi:hypothetical protein
MHEDIPFINMRVPKEFTHENGKLTGVTFEVVEAVYDDKGRRKLVPSGAPDEHYECDDVLVAVGPGELVPLDRARHRPGVRRVGHAEGGRGHLPVDGSQRLLRRRRGVRTEEHHLGRGARPRGRRLDPQALLRRGGRRSPPPGATLVSQKMGIHEWSYDNDISNDERYRVAAARQA